MPTRILTLVMLLATAELLPAADSWPQFRGPGGQGHSSATGVPTTWSETENVRWKVPVSGRGWSSPVVQGTQIWLTSSFEQQGSLRALCYDRESGELVHNVEIFRKEDLGRIASKNTHASPTPVIDGKHVFVHFGSHGTACLTTDGQIVWRKRLEYDHRHGPGGSPIVWNDLLIVVCDGPDVQYTVALDKATGEVRWKADQDGEQAYSTPIVIKVNGVQQLLTSQGEALIAYAPADGAELWRCRHGGHSVVPRPVAGNGLVYFCTGYWTPSLLAVRPDGMGDITDSHVEFSVRRGVPHNPSPLLIEERLYLVSDQGVLSCINANDGTEIWRQRLGGSFSASPTVVGGNLYLFNEAGSAYVVKHDDTFQLVAENQLDGQTLASPAFVDRALYVRSDTHLYRIEEPRNVRASATTSRKDTPMLIR